MLKHIRTILYATDLSNTSAYAFRYAACLSKALDARLHILHAVEPMSEEARMTLTAFITDPTAREDALRRRMETARRLLRKARDGGACLVVLPENFSYMARSEAERRKIYFENALKLLSMESPKS